MTGVNVLKCVSIILLATGAFTVPIYAQPSWFNVGIESAADPALIFLSVSGDGSTWIYGVSDTARLRIQRNGTLVTNNIVLSPGNVGIGR